MRQPRGAVYTANRRYQAELRRLDVAALHRLAAALKTADEAVVAEVVRLAAKIEAARDAGDTINRAWLTQADRLIAVEARAQGEYRLVVGTLREVLAGNVDGALMLASRHARGLVEASLGPRVQTSWATFPVEQIRHAVGFASSGPLAQLIDVFGVEAAGRVRDAIVQHIALGRNPRRLAAAVRDATGITRARALTIARTETLRAYREATRQSFVANEGLLDGWVWTAALDRRTCVACWAMNGTVHPVSEGLDGHPNCRCAMVPLTRSWSSILGVPAPALPESRVEVVPGAEVFAALPREAQLQVVGPSRLSLLDSGRIEFSDLAVQRHSRAWGSSRQPATLAELRGGKRRRRARGRARRVRS